MVRAHHTWLDCHAAWSPSCCHPTRLTYPACISSLRGIAAVAAFKSAGERGHSTPQSSPRQAQALGEIKAQLDHLKGLIAGLGLQHGPAIHE